MEFPTERREKVRPRISKEDSDLSGLVLLVDDEPMVRRMLRRVLERMGLNVVEARDGIEALEVYAEHQSAISVVLLDWDMPRKDGSETLRELRELACTAPILVLSGHGLNADGYTPDADQAQGFLQKPFRRLGLESQLREVLA
jgi:CheY-like chemotaxis protein